MQREKEKQQELERFQQQQRDQQQQLLQQQMMQNQQQQQQMLNTPMSSTETLFLQRQAEKSIQMQMQTQMMLDQVSNQFEKILKFMDNVDKRISSLENLTNEILTKQVVIMDQQQNTPSLTKVVENVKQLEEDQKLAKQLQEQFNSESVVPESDSFNTESVECPKCSKELKLTEMDEHIDKCMTEDEKKNKSSWFSFFKKKETPPPTKEKETPKPNTRLPTPTPTTQPKKKTPQVYGPGTNKPSTTTTTQQMPLPYAQPMFNPYNVGGSGFYYPTTMPPAPQQFYYPTPQPKK